MSCKSVGSDSRREVHALNSCSCADLGKILRKGRMVGGDGAASSRVSSQKAASSSSFGRTRARGGRGGGEARAFRDAL